MEQKTFRLASFKTVDQDQGTFEAIVSVFGNVDRGGDRVMPGAFKDSLAAWEQKGRPIPVIFAHDWGNLDAHIGEVLEAKETDDGLWVKGQLNMDEEYAQRVYKKLKRGTIAEFSFAYDVVDSYLVKEKDGSYINELRAVDLFEVGPCLVGMNPETELLGVKENLTRRREDAKRTPSQDAKAGARNSAKDLARIQAIHDAACELGAKCAQSEDNEGGEGKARSKDETDGKSKGARPGTLAARVALELLELDA